MQIKQISSISETYGKSNGNSRIQVGMMLLCMTVTIAKYLPRASDYTAAGLLSTTDSSSSPSTTDACFLSRDVGDAIYMSKIGQILTHCPLSMFLLKPQLLQLSVPLSYVQTL